MSWGLFLYRLRSVVSALLLFMSVAAAMILVYRFGFMVSEATHQSLLSYSRLLLLGLWGGVTTRFLINTLLLGYNNGSFKGKKPMRRHVDRYNLWRVGGYMLFTLIVVIGLSLHYGFIQPDNFTGVLTGTYITTFTLLGVSLLELSQGITSILSRRANPSIILSGSFLTIILLGSLLLMLPNCTHEGISYVDSLFISASAVCVTGLTPIDISSTLTTQGLIILLLLIQIGGLGIMTITSFFGLFFMGGGTLASQVLISDLLSGERISGLLHTLLKIIAVTLTVEAIGALIIYSIMLGNTNLGAEGSIFFAIFHAVSAFCNAGFSTLHGNLYDPLVRNLSSLQYTISWLVVFGGIGFPLFANVLRGMGLLIGNVFRRFSGLRPKVEPRLWSLNSYIVIRMTILLLVVPTILMTAMEWNHSLAEFSFWDKLSQGFLMAVTPRTAGFNGVDVAKMMPATLVVTMVLMWIGGAPQSTAGGIKVTTFYIALRNITSGFLKSEDGKMDEIQAQRRQIANSSVRRAFAVIILSTGIITTSTIVLAWLHPEIGLQNLLFEVFSAIGTVGLSIGVTPQLGVAGKVIVISLMFIGRVGIISMLSIFIRNSAHRQYSYPHENIMIN